MPRRIVAIDDSPEIVDLYEEILGDEGYEIVGRFTRPPPDPKLIGALSPDLIIMDLRFGPTVAGLALLEMIKTDAQTAVLPVVVCTADQTAVRDAQPLLMKHGAHIVYKPFRIAELKMAVRQVLD